MFCFCEIFWFSSTERYKVVSYSHSYCRLFAHSTRAWITGESEHATGMALGIYPHSDVEVALQAETVKLSGVSGKQRRSVRVCVSIKSGARCESILFCPFNTAEKFGANSQPLLISTSKAAWQQFFSLHGAKLSCRFAESSDDGASASPPLRAYGYTPSLFLLSRFSPPPPPPAAPPARRYMDTYL